MDFGTLGGARTTNGECVLPVVKHGGEPVMILGCMSAKGDKEMTFINATMNVCGYAGLPHRMTLIFLKPGRRGKHAWLHYQKFLKKNGD